MLKLASMVLMSKTVKTNICFAQEKPWYIVKLHFLFVDFSHHPVPRRLEEGDGDRPNQSHQGLGVEPHLDRGKQGRKCLDL